MDNLNLFIPIKKVDVAQRLVYGTLAAEMPDHSGEIMDYETSAPNWKNWSAEIHKVTDGRSSGNVRAMHTNIAAGKLIDIAFDDVGKSITGCAKIVDDNEWQKVLEGVYTGFSMGGKYEKRWTDKENPALKRYTASVHEVSIVDLPCIPCATFDVIKADGSTELRKFQVAAKAEEVGVTLTQGWKAEDGAFFVKKADSVAHNLNVALTKATSTVVATAMDALKKAQDAMSVKEGVDLEQPVEKSVEAEVAVKPADELPVTKTVDAVDTPAEAKIIDMVAVVKAASDNIQKGLCDIGVLVDVITSLSWLQDGMAWDALFAGKETTLPADLKSILADLSDFLAEVVADATATITADKAAGLTERQVEQLRKVSGNADLLKDFVAAKPAVDNEALTKMASEHEEAMAKVAAERDLEKAAKVEFEKAVGTLTGGIEELTKRIAHLEAQPAPAKGVVTTVLKGHETPESGSKQTSVEAIARKYAHLPPELARAAINKELAGN